MSECAEAVKTLVEPKAVKPKMPNSAVLLSPLTPDLGSTPEAVWPRVVGSDKQNPWFKPGRGWSPGSQRCLSLHEGPVEEPCICRYEDR